MNRFIILLITPLLIFGQEFESNLPIIIINTENNEILDDPRITAHMGVINNMASFNKLTDIFNDYNGQISICTY